MAPPHPRSPAHPRPIGDPSFRAGRRDVILLPLGLAVFWVVYSGPPVPEVGGFDLRLGLSGPAASIPWKWLGAIALVAVVLYAERRQLATMLLTRPSGKDLEWAVYAFGATMGWSWVAGLFLPPLDDRGTGPIVALGVLGVIALVITTAVTEEVAFRGYLAERLGAVLGSRWWGAALSLVIFVWPHVTYFGPAWLLHHLGGALAIAALVLLLRNLVVGILVHLLVNAPILIPTVLAGG